MPPKTEHVIRVDAEVYRLLSSKRKALASKGEKPSMNAAIRAALKLKR